jgi:transposase
MRPRFLPPPPIRALRDLTRTRVALVQTRSQTKNRGYKIREDPNIQVASVVSALFGVSGRRMRAALIAGERDPRKRAALALGKFRRQLPALALALTGQFTAHHARIMQAGLELVELLERQLGALDQQSGEFIAPVQLQLLPWDSMPGVDATAARAIRAELGTDRSRFGADARLAAWAGGCPGNNESAGTRWRGRARKGHRYLRRVLGQCAWAARKPPTYLGRTFHRLEARLGGKKAAGAVAHNILVIVYHLLAEGTLSEETRYDHLQSRQEAHQQKRAVQALERLG